MTPHTVTKCPKMVVSLASLRVAAARRCSSVQHVQFALPRTLAPRASASKALSATARKSFSTTTFRMVSFFSFLVFKVITLASYIYIYFWTLSFTVILTTGIQADHRIERDAFGEIKVQTDKYWGAQTER